MGASLSITTRSPRETFLLGERVGRSLTGGETIALVGELGGGKTVFVKGLAAGYGVMDAEREVTSPTYTLLHVYEGTRGRIHHFDLYRLRGAAQFDDLGPGDQFGDPGGVTVVEWADRAPESLPAGRLEVRVCHAGLETRRWELLPTGQRAVRIVAALQEEGDLP